MGEMSPNGWWWLIELHREFGGDFRVGASQKIHVHTQATPISISSTPTVRPEAIFSEGKHHLPKVLTVDWRSTESIVCNLPFTRAELRTRS